MRNSKDESVSDRCSGGSICRWGVLTGGSARNILDEGVFIVVVLWALILVGCNERTPPSPPEGCQGISGLVISVPGHGDTVLPVVNAQGKVPDPKSAVWIVVNPHESASQFWVQDEVRVTSDCAWMGPVHFAENSPQFSGQKFDVMAVADPKEPLHKAEVLSSWPTGKWNSKIITVTRQ